MPQSNELASYKDAMTCRISTFSIALLFFCTAGYSYSQLKQPTPEKLQVHPLPQPSDLKLLLEAQDGRTDFHLGEIVNLRFAYSSTTPGRYIHFQTANRYPGASSWRIQCEPGDSVIDRDKDSGRLNAWRILHAGPRCSGLGGGMGSACGDCTFDFPVTEKPTHWFPFILNQRVQLIRPGQYSCIAKTADVCLAISSSETSAIFELSSAPVKLNVKSDAAWSRAALQTALLQLQTEPCLSNLDANQRCWDSSQVVRFLDTEDSLKAAVRLFTGTENSYSQEQMWLAILQSSRPKLAIELLHQRLLDSDFTVKESVLETLVAISLREGNPAAFAVNADPADYHQQAIALLRNYVRELGQSLNKKPGTALDVSLKTYARNAAETFCESESLIPEAEMRAVLASIGR